MKIQTRPQQFAQHCQQIKVKVLVFSFLEFFIFLASTYPLIICHYNQFYVDTVSLQKISMPTPKTVTGNSRGWGSQKSNLLKEGIKLNLNF